MNDRGNFGTKIGIILATTGSAVGLGNIWRFPYMTGENGGAAFILIYLVCIFLLGIPGMVCEFIVGRHGQANAARSYATICSSNGKKGNGWSAIGYMGVFTAMVILGFYAVVAGWCLQYLFASLMGKIHGTPLEIQNYFVNFSTNAFFPILWTIAFIFITHAVVVKGIRNGIEKASKFLMPLLFILLIVIVVASCLLPNSVEGIRFLFQPDFSKINSKVFLDALGQAFFSLSLGTACLCTYASYYKKETNLFKSAFQIASIDTLIALLAGLMIFPAAFSVNVQPDSGPSLIFITLPNVFQQAFSSVPAIGYIISMLFYALLVLAALSSTISMHEIGTAFFHEEFHLTRKKSAYIVTIICCIIGSLCALSCGAVKWLNIHNLDLLTICDNLTAKFLLPLGSFLTCICVGWFAPKKIIAKEFSNNEKRYDRLFPPFLFFVRFISPICIIAIFLHELNIL